ncbi:MAG: hypothetical protein AAF975_00110 [Spirochaetota bacterium]
MEIEIGKNGETLNSDENGFYRLRLEACAEILCPHLKIWGPLEWLNNFRVGDEIELKGQGKILFTGPVQKVKEVERSRALVEAFEPLSDELLLNFSREQWSNILQEVCPECNINADDFELKHYSLKGTKRQHLRNLHSLLELFNQKNYWFYLDETNSLQVHERASNRGQAENLGTLVSHGLDAETYKAFPLLVGMSSAKGIAERLELSISNAKEQLRVWWGEAKGEVKGVIKDTMEYLKDSAFGDGKIINSSDRVVYAIVNGTGAAVSVPSGNVYSALIDGAVDVIGKQVYKMNENTYLEFTSEYKFIIKDRERLEAVSGKFSNEPYGVYLIDDNSDEGIHSETGHKSTAIKNWYDKARIL